VYIPFLVFTYVEMQKVFKSLLRKIGYMGFHIKRGFLVVTIAFITLLVFAIGFPTLSSLGFYDNYDPLNNLSQNPSVTATQVWTKVSGEEGWLQDFITDGNIGGGASFPTCDDGEILAYDGDSSSWHCIVLASGLSLPACTTSQVLYINATGSLDCLDTSGFGGLLTCAEGQTLVANATGQLNCGSIEGLNCEPGQLVSVGQDGELTCASSTLFLDETYVASSAPIQGYLPALSRARSTYDENDNMYYLFLTGLGALDFGNGVTLSAAPVSWHSSMVIVKFNKDGVAQWANRQRAYSVSFAPDRLPSLHYQHEHLLVGGADIRPSGQYGLLTIDTFGGLIVGNNTFSHSDTQVISRFDATFPNQITSLLATAGGVYLRKSYDSTTAWQKTITISPSSSASMRPESMVVADNGNIYVLYTLFASTTNSHTFNFGNGVEVLVSANTAIPVLVGFDQQGNVLWLRDLLHGYITRETRFSDMALDSQGNIVLLTHDTHQLPGYSGSGVYLNKFAPCMPCQSYFSKTYQVGQIHPVSVSVDENDNIYVSGTLSNTGMTLGNFDDSVYVVHTGSATLVSYFAMFNSTGSPQWLTTPTSSAQNYGSRLFKSSTGSLIGMGHTSSVTGESEFGSGVTVNQPGVFAVEFTKQSIPSSLTGTENVLVYSQNTIKQTTTQEIANLADSVEKLHAFADYVTASDHRNLRDIADLSFEYEPHSTYVYDLYLLISSSSGSNGITLALSTSGWVPTNGLTFTHVRNSDQVMTGGSTNPATGAVVRSSSGVPAANQRTIVTGSGILRSSSEPGIAKLQHASETNTLSTIHYGSVMVVRKIN
jgi:hypothetical protein